VIVVGSIVFLVALIIGGGMIASASSSKTGFRRATEWHKRKPAL
jgi:hypothetical protein